MASSTCTVWAWAASSSSRAASWALRAVTWRRDSRAWCSSRPSLGASQECHRPGRVARRVRGTRGAGCRRARDWPWSKSSRRRRHRCRSEAGYPQHRATLAGHDSITVASVVPASQFGRPRLAVRAHLGSQFGAPRLAVRGTSARGSGHLGSRFGAPRRWHVDRARGAASSAVELWRAHAARLPGPGGADRAVPGGAAAGRGGHGRGVHRARHHPRSSGGAQGRLAAPRRRRRVPLPVRPRGSRPGGARLAPRGARLRLRRGGRTALPGDPADPRR